MIKSHILTQKSQNLVVYTASRVELTNKITGEFFGACKTVIALEIPVELIAVIVYYRKP